MIFFRKKHSFRKIDLPKEFLPKHLAFIMDGNGRWAKKRHLTRRAGHAHGAETLKRLAKYCNKIGIKHLTVYAFSTENWKRPDEEVGALMKLFEQYLKDIIDDFDQDNIKLCFMGEMSALSESLQKLVSKATEVSKNNTGMILNIALNYGSKAEIAKAAREIAELAKNGNLDIDEISPEDIENHLYTAGQPDVDLLIRTSGEYRLSNFMLWQLAYAELFVTDTFWPDFDENELNSILLNFSKRNRRFGGV